MCVSYFDSGVGGVSHGLQQLVVLWVKRDGEGTVNDSPWGPNTLINDQSEAGF